MRRLFLMALGSLLAGSAASPAAAQVAADPHAQHHAEHQAVQAVVDRLFDGMRTRDTTMIRSTFSDQALFFGLGPDGNVRTDAPSAFISSIARAPAGLVLDEVLHDVEIRVDGPLATVWTYYDFFAGENFSHCGYDAMQLLKVRGEWKIVALADTRRKEGCRQQRG